MGLEDFFTALSAMDTYWVAVGFFICVGVILIGYAGRHVTKQGLPFRCPIWVDSILVSIALGFYGLFVNPVWLSPELWTLIYLYLAGYPIGYLLANPNDHVSIDLVDEYNNSDAENVYYYYHRKTRELKFMHQTYWGCTLAMIGFHCPLYMNLSEAKRTRRHTTKTKFLKAKLDSAYVAKIHDWEPYRIGIFRRRKDRVIYDKDGNETYEPQYWINVNVERHYIEFAEGTIEDPNTFLLKTDTYHEALQAASYSRSQALRAQVEANVAAYKSSSRVIADMFSLDIEGPQAMEDLQRRLKEIEKKRKGGEKDGVPMVGSAADNSAQEVS